MICYLFRMANWTCDPCAIFSRSAMRQCFPMNIAPEIFGAVFRMEWMNYSLQSIFEKINVNK